MTVQITLLQDAPAGSGGGVWRAGDTKTAADDYARALIGRGAACAADNSLPDVPFDSTQVAAVAVRLQRPAVTRVRQLVSVFAGNSIAAFGLWAGSGSTAGYPSQSEFGYAQQFAGLRIAQQSKATAGTYTDACGNYGHAAQSSAQINAELASVHFAALDAANIVPDLWIDLALFENDIGPASSDASAASLALLDQRVKAIRAKYPGILYICGTPRPDGRNSTAIRKTMQASVYAGILARDDSVSFFACDLTRGTYGEPTDETIPQAGYTYTSGLSDALTDVANVHPRQNAASINGRRLAATIARICDEPVISGLRVQSQNDGMLGTGAYSSNKTTGTVATSMVTTAAPAGTNAAIVAAALNPGQQYVFTPDAATLNDTLHFNLSALTLSPEPMRFSVYSRVRINSGASKMSSICARAVVVYSSGNSTHLTQNNAAVSNPTVQPCVYQDGDELTLVSPEFDFSGAVTVTSLTAYVRAYYYSASGATPLDITILALGILPVGRKPVAITPGSSPYSYTAAANGTVVVTGGTVSAIELTRNGTTYVTLASLTGLLVPVSRGDTVRVTYTVAPTVTFVATNPV